MKTSKLFAPKYWITSDKKKILIKDLEDLHLLNIINFLKIRKAFREKNKEIYSVLLKEFESRESKSTKKH
jgi:hypothetical protein